ncbi:hypothetical protein M8J76_015063 [Diaphorina citri]|nr:hypothetical protein M8J76_015063 [Diaphorina citri]KAI5727755.1 hypothetical protein M8J77_006452 [Diaphorina citri]
MYVLKLCLLLLIASIHKAQSWPGWSPEYTVELTNNGPIVAGGTITFRCVVKKYNNPKPEDNFKYIWEDNAIDKHSGVIESTSNVFEWNVTYAHRYYPGMYEMQVNVERKYAFLYVPVNSDRKYFNITGFLNGDLNLTQNHKEIAQDKFVALNQEMMHEVALHTADANYLKRNATDIETYFFIDCQFINATKGLTFKHNYTTLNADHLIEVLVIVSFDPPVIVPTTPAPPSGNGTTTVPPALALASNQTLTGNSSTPNSTVAPSLASSSTSLPMSSSESPSTTMLPLVSAFPYVCNNSTQVSPDLSKTYGYFSKNVKVQAAITNVKASGNMWLQHGDMLGLDIKCNGTGPFSFCYDYVPGSYNVTGDESCAEYISDETDCSFHIDHYFRESQAYTMIVVITNNVGKVVTPVGVNVYETTKHAQLSVIVVPIAALSLAVILVVFGLAYYVQSRNRFVIETADFDFSNTSTDMEYKTFRERLREAVSAAINKTEDFVEQESVWSPPGQSAGRRYGSMQ